MKFTQEDLNSLFRYALSLTHRDEWAYDLVSHAVEKVLARPFVLNKKAYAKRCIRNKYFDEYKRQEESLEEVQEQQSLADLEKIVADKEQVAQILAKLGPLERELLYLWAVEDYTLQEISNLTKTPRGTLTSRLARLKTKIKAMQTGGANE